MEPRNYLDQAKSFLGGRGTKLALRIAPLALMAAGAMHAGTITLTPVSGGVSGSCVSCSGAFASAGGTANSSSLTSGISFYGSGGVLGSSTGTEGIQFSYAGSASGTGPATLNVAWDFSGSIGFSSSSLSAQIAATPQYNWDLLFGFNGGTATTCAGCSGMAPADGSAVTGTGTIAVPSGAISSYTAVFDFTFNPDDEDETLDIDIPEGLTINVTNPAVAGVPEPSTLLLMIPGLGLFGLVARRRRRQA